MFVKTTRRRRGDRTYQYLSLVESVREGDRVGHRTLLRLGEVTALRASGQLERIVAALESHLQRDRVEVAALAAEDAPAVGAVAAVWSLWRELGLDRWFATVGAERGAERLEHAVFAMAANRLVADRPRSKRALPEWVAAEVAMPAGFAPPSLEQYYRALSAVADAKAATEQHLYSSLCDLTNLDLRLVCYDLTSSYLEGSVAPSDRFPSKAFGYSRDRRSDRPQIVIGLLCTGQGIPIAHHVFAGNTADVTTLPGVLADLAQRFGVRACLVADRGLISEENLALVTSAGFDHIMATRLHHDSACAAALEAAHRPGAVWVPVPEAGAAACDVTLPDGGRAVVAASGRRWQRDSTRTGQLVARTEAQLLALEDRVRAGRLRDPGRIGRAAQRILGPSPVARLFEVEIGQGRFVYHYHEAALASEEALAGHYVLATSLTPAQATTAQVVMAWRQLTTIERRFRVLKDFLHLRPIRHWTERRVHGHVAVCVYASLLEALIAQRLAAAGVRDPDLGHQPLSCARALRELERVRAVTLTAGGRTIDLVTRRTPLQRRTLDALGVDTSAWDQAHIH